MGFTKSRLTGAHNTTELTNFRWYTYTPWFGLKDIRERLSTLYTFFVQIKHDFPMPLALLVLMETLVSFAEMFIIFIASPYTC